MAGGRLYDPLGQAELQAETPPRRPLEVRRVSERVIADLVALGVHPRDELRVRRGLAPDHEEGGTCLVASQDVEHPRRPERVRAIVKGEGHGARPEAGLKDLLRSG